MLDNFAYCQSCGSQESYDGWHLSCENGHMFCKECFYNFTDLMSVIISTAEVVAKEEDLTVDEKTKLDQHILKITLSKDESLACEFLKETDFFFSSIPAKHCPICQRRISEDMTQQKDLFNYLLKEENLTLEELAKKLDAQFKTYGDLIKYTNE